MNQLTTTQLAKAGSRIDKNMEIAKNQHDSAIEYAINAGEELIQVAASVDDLKEWLEKNCHVAYIQSTRLIRVATHKWQARRLIADGDATSIDSLVKILPKTKEAPEMTSADADKLGYVGSVASIDKVKKDDWHTPAHYVNAAREVMGRITLDPFSSVQANSTIKADRILTLADDAFSRTWGDNINDTCWMNPPYSRGLAGKAVTKFIEQYRAEAFGEAIVLMNNATDTSWFNDLFQYCHALAFTRGRIAFEDNVGNKSSGNTRGQVFFYFGPNSQDFMRVFDEDCNCNTLQGRLIW